MVVWPRSQRNLMDNIHVILAAPPRLKNTLRKLIISFFSMQPKAIKSLGGFESLEHLYIHGVFVSSIRAGRYSPYHGNIDEEALPYDVVMLELVKAEFENSTRLDLGYSKVKVRGTSLTTRCHETFWDLWRQLLKSGKGYGLVALDIFTTINRANLAGSNFIGKPIPTMYILIYQNRRVPQPSPC